MKQERIARAIAAIPHEALAAGFIRYEAVRRMTVGQFREIMMVNIRGDGRFDDLVDEFIERQAEPSPASSAQANGS